HSLSLSLALSHSSLFRSLPLFHLLPHSCGCFFFPLFLLPLLFLTLFYSSALLPSLSLSHTLFLALSLRHTHSLSLSLYLSISLSLSPHPCRHHRPLSAGHAASH